MQDEEGMGTSEREWNVGWGLIYCNRGWGGLRRGQPSGSDGLGAFNFQVMPLGEGKMELCVGPGEPPRSGLRCDSHLAFRAGFTAQHFWR